MTENWRQRPVKIILPLSTALAMWNRAQKFARTQGGRFEVQANGIVLWPTAFRDAETAPTARIHIEWYDPTPEHATITQIDWNVAEGSTEANARRVIDVLAGREPKGDFPV